MRRRRRPGLGFGLGLGLLLVGVHLGAPTRAVVAEEGAPDEAAAAKAIAAWGKTCQACHAAPDTRFETDRAFLAQIPETT